MIVIAGPTASGKTDLAVALALKLGGEIVCADSRQVYRTLNAATSKPSSAQRALVAHHLLDVADPNEFYDAARFARDARTAIMDIRHRAKVPIVCGGTGLYLRALIDGLSPLPARDLAVRARLEALAQREGPLALHTRLAHADATAAAKIPPKNLHRIVRALEIVELTGKTISAHWAAGRVGGLSPSACLRLEVPVDLLRARIELRARAMWPALLAEVRTLVPRFFRGDEPGFTSLGYREAMSVLRSELSSEQGLDEMIRATCAYAKRQRTWFHRQLEAIPIDAGKNPELTVAAALKAIKSGAPEPS